MDKKIEDIRNALRFYNLKEVAKELEVHENALYYIKSGKTKNPHKATVDKLCDFLGIEK